MMSPSASTEFTPLYGLNLDIEGDTATIDGYGAHPAFETVSSFFSAASNIVNVMQSSNSSDTNGQHAATWAINYVENDPNAPYGVVYSHLYAYGPNDETYCSKIAWDAWAYGAGHYLYNSSYICQPYDLMSTTQTANTSVLRRIYTTFS